MNELTKPQKVKNIVAFLSIIFGENYEALEAIMGIHPDYLIEKFDRYVLATRPESDWGLNPSLRRAVFDRYCEKYKLPIYDEL